MTPASNGQVSIIRTERGLTISGTRITLYDVMDYVTQYPPKFIRAMLNLTDEQVHCPLSYIDAHRAEIEAEYQFVLKETEELRQYYEVQKSENSFSPSKNCLLNDKSLTRHDMMPMFGVGVARRRHRTIAVLFLNQLKIHPFINITQGNLKIDRI